MRKITCIKIIYSLLQLQIIQIYKCKNIRVYKYVYIKLIACTKGILILNFIFK